MDSWRNELEACGGTVEGMVVAWAWWVEARRGDWASWKGERWWWRSHVGGTEDEAI